MINKKRANILTENVIFIVLNLIFLMILILFITSRAGGVAVVEEKYSKQIALMLDSAKPGMTIILNIEDALDKKEKDFDAKKIVNINTKDNIVTFKLREKGGYSYHFFNNLDNYDFSSQFDAQTDSYVFVIEQKKEVTNAE